MVTNTGYSLEVIEQVPINNDYFLVWLADHPAQ